MLWRFSRRLFRARLGLCGAGLGVFAGESPEAVPGPSVVRIVAVDAGYRLERNGAAHFVRGAVGGDRLDLLAAAGANSVRCGPSGLDAAQRAGLVCLVGLPLGNPRHGFDYADRVQVEAQFVTIRDLVRRHRGHPALLLWGLGNEPEIGTRSEERVALWSEVNRIAVMIRAEDPDHPVIAVLGDAYRRILGELDRHCPALDAVGLNAYADMLTLPEDIRRQGWRRPYLVTEFGPRGHWQSSKTPWRMPVEPTSTAKAEFYERAYRHAVEGRADCLGAFAFYWSHKQEKTHTWYGMFLPDGARTEAVDVMTRLWSGRWPTNRCPQIAAPGIRILGTGAGAGNPLGAVLQAGRRVRCDVAVTDPEGDPVRVEWDLREDVAGHDGVGGDPEPETAPIEGVVMSRERPGHAAEIALPARPGCYRLFAYAYDGHGNAATANIPILAVTPGTTSGSAR